MDVLIEWEHLPWDEPEEEPRPGMRGETPGARTAKR